MSTVTSAATKKDILVAARGLIENKGWTQYAYARDAQLNTVGLEKDAASCFCSLGAVFRAQADAGLHWSGADFLVDRAASERGYPSAPDFNDDPMTTKADVLSLFDRAIELAEKGGA